MTSKRNYLPILLFVERTGSKKEKEVSKIKMKLLFVGRTESKKEVSKIKPKVLTNIAFCSADGI